MRAVLIECTSSILDVAKKAVVNAGGKVHGVFQDIAHDSLWLKVECESCEEIPEGCRIPVVEASIAEIGGEPHLRIGSERDMTMSFRLVQEVK